MLLKTHRRFGPKRWAIWHSGWPSMSMHTTQEWAQSAHHNMHLGMFPGDGSWYVVIRHATTGLARGRKGQGCETVSCFNPGSWRRSFIYACTILHQYLLPQVLVVYISDVFFGCASHLHVSVPIVNHSWNYSKSSHESTMTPCSCWYPMSGRFGGAWAPGEVPSAAKPSQGDESTGSIQQNTWGGDVRDLEQVGPQRLVGWFFHVFPRFFPDFFGISLGTREETQLMRWTFWNRFLGVVDSKRMLDVSNERLFWCFGPDCQSLRGHSCLYAESLGNQRIGHRRTK